MKNIQRQDRNSVIKPLTGAPNVIPSAAALANTPNAVPRCSLGKYFAIIAWGRAYRMDAPIPWVNLEITSIKTEFDKPHIKELDVNIIKPMLNNFFNPIVSPNLPKINNNDTTIRLYDITIHEISLVDALKVCVIDGKATFTT